MITGRLVPASRDRVPLDHVFSLSNMSSTTTLQNGGHKLTAAFACHFFSTLSDMIHLILLHAGSSCNGACDKGDETVTRYVKRSIKVPATTQLDRVRQSTMNVKGTPVSSGRT